MKKSKTKLPRELHIGTYQLGYRWVRFIGTSSKRGEGSFTFMQDAKGKPSLMKVSLGCDRREAWGVLIHETIEAVLHDMELAYQNPGSYSTRRTDSYLFAFDHRRFDDMTGRVGFFLSECHKDFEAAWHKINPKS